MKILNPNFKADLFWANLSQSEGNVLLLDYDGTLSPFTTDRDNARPYTGVIERLESLIEMSSSRVVIISGRDIETLKGLLDLEICPELWGSHGVERFDSENGYRIFINENIGQGLEQIRAWAQAQNLEKYAEFKPAGCAFHWRGLMDDTAIDIKTRVSEYWQERSHNYGMRLHDFDGGIEIRPSNMDKGSAVKNIIDEIDVDIPLAYLGDDLTDEDAFRALGKRGLKVLVGEMQRETLADIRITPPQELLEFLDKWIELSYTASK